MRFKDRKPTKPNRREIVREDTGERFYATVKRADDPLPGDEGVSLNADKLNELVAYKTETLQTYKELEQWRTIEATLPFSITASILADRVAYGNGTFAAVSSANIATSPDGITWTSRTSPSANLWLSVAYGNGVFVAVGQTSSGNNTSTAITSPDGITWTQRTLPASQIWRSIAFGNGIFVAARTASVIGGSETTTAPCATSPDGTTWTTQTTPATNYWRSIAFGNGIFVAVGYQGRMMTSPDGITWTQRTSSATGVLDTVIFGNGLFLARDGNVLVYSADGITWIQVSTGTSYYITFADGLFMRYASAANVYVSTDCVTWKTVLMPSGNTWGLLKRENNTWYALGGTVAAASKEEFEDITRLLDGNDVRIGDALKIETGFYMGTGTYGAANPNRLTFSFKPTIVFLFVQNSVFDARIIWDKSNQFLAQNYASIQNPTNISFNDNTMTWYGSGNIYQFNELNIRYHYIALGY